MPPAAKPTAGASAPGFAPGHWWCLGGIVAFCCSHPSSLTSKYTDAAWNGASSNARGKCVKDYEETASIDETDVKVVEVLDVEDDLDTGMHRVNVCKLLPIEITGG